MTDAELFLLAVLGISLIAGCIGYVLGAHGRMPTRAWLEKHGCYRCQETWRDLED